MRIEDAYVPWHHFLHRSEAEVVNASVERARISPEAKSNPQPPHAMHRSLGEVVAKGCVDPSQTGEEPLYLQALVALLLTCQQEMVELQTVVNAAELLLFLSPL